MKTLKTLFFLLLISGWAHAQTWQLLSGAAIYDVGSEPSLAINSGGVPYVVYKNITSFPTLSGLTVKKFNGANWEIVGSENFTPEYAIFHSIVLNSSGVPYVAFLQNDGNKLPTATEPYAKPTVMRYTGVNWETVGIERFSLRGANGLSMAIDPAGTPYVAFNQWFSSSMNRGNYYMNVMKFDGTNWVYVGNANFSSLNPDFPSIAIDASGTPFVSYLDYANGSKATVMKFSSISGLWENVGIPGFSPEISNYTDIAIDPSGTPYVVFDDMATSNKATVMKFNGLTSAWEIVGNAGFSADYITDPRIAIGSSGTPYVVYADGGNGDQATVMGFNGSSWETVGPPGFSEPGIPMWNTCIAIHPSGAPYVVCEDGSNGWGYKYLPGMSTWTGATNSDWNTPTNWSSNAIPAPADNIDIPDVTNDPVVNTTPGAPAACADLTIESGAIVTVAPGKALTVNGAITNSAGFNGLVVQSDATGTGSLIAGTTAANGTVERYIEGRADDLHGWHFLSSPVAAQDVQPEFVPNPPGTTQAFLYWDEPSGQWINSKDPSNLWVPGFDDHFLVGKGYLVNYNSTVTKNFAGLLNVSNVTITGLTKSGGTYTGWHLLGNPFPSAITWNTGWTKSNIANVAKIWDEMGSSYTDTRPGEVIPAMQGFMVQVTAAPGSLTIPASARVHSSWGWYKSTGTPKIKLKVHDITGNTFQESVVMFNPQATAGYDQEFDSRFLAGYAPQFYSVVEDEFLSTNVLPELSNQTTIPLYFVKTAGSNYSIEAVKLDDIPAQVFLTDLKTNQTQNLKENPVYAFTSTAGDDPGRFLLSFSHVGIDYQDGKHGGIYVYDRTLFLTSPGNATVEVYNLMGQKIVTDQTNQEELYRLKLQVVSGYYIVRLTSGQNVVTEKVFVK